MNVSVVVCAYSMERWDDLAAALNSCRAQTQAPIEVILVVDYNEELLARAVGEFPDVIVTMNASLKGLSGARNTGVSLASSEIVAFLDDDAYADPRWLENLVTPFEDQSVAGVGGWIIPQWPVDAPPWFPETFLWVLGCSYAGLPADQSRIRNPIGSNMALRKSVIERVGGFSSGLGRISDAPLGGEETELCIRYRARYSDEYFVLARGAVVHHRVPPSRLALRYFLTRCWSEGVSKAVIASLVGSGAGLAAERAHVLRAVPREIVLSTVRATREPTAMVRRIALIVAGGGCTVAGFTWGRLRLRWSSHEAPDASKLSRHDLSTWRPIALAQVSSEELSRTTIRCEPGQRVWIEVKREGQIVGVREVVADSNVIATSTLQMVTESFREVTPSHLRDVDDQRLARASIIVPTICEDPAELSDLVDSLVALDYPDFEVIVVDNRTTDGDVSLPRFSDSTRVRVVKEARPGVSAARNAGAAVATGDIFAFTDDDVVVDGGWLRAIGARFANEPAVDAIGGLVLPAELDAQPQLWFEEFYGGFSQSFEPSTIRVSDHDPSDRLFPYNAGRFGAGCNIAARRSAFEAAGGFDMDLGVGTPTRGGEDLAFFLKLLFRGGTLAFEPGALVRHHHRRTKGALLKQVFGYGVGLGAMYSSVVRKDPRHVVAMLRRLPAAVSLLMRPRSERSVSTASSYPRSMLFLQIVGIAWGPVAYLRSVRQGRRYSA